MHGLTTELLSRACRIFLERAYPDGELTMATSRRPFLNMAPEQPLSAFLGVREVCEKLLTPTGALRGYAFRLGSVRFPHLKLQVTDHNQGATCVFSVDTHDTLRCTVAGAEADAWAKLQADNRCLKEAIEREWERQGLLTFNGLLRQGLTKK
jgi:hypothetical protein